MVRKIPREYENPIDNALLDAAERALPLCRALRLTPNQVTAGSILFKALSVWALAVRAHPAAFLASYGVAVWLDYLDGHYARADDMVTRLGDFMDHGSDVLHIAAVLIVVSLRLGVPAAFPPLLAIVGVFALSTVHIGAQQRYYRDHGRDEVGGHAESLDALIALAPADYARWLPVTRWFGVGAAQTAAALIAAYCVYWRRR